MWGDEDDSGWGISPEEAEASPPAAAGVADEVQQPAAAPPASAFGAIGDALQASVNAVESATGLDLDRDGDVGQEGSGWGEEPSGWGEAPSGWGEQEPSAAAPAAVGAAAEEPAPKPEPEPEPATPPAFGATGSALGALGDALEASVNAVESATGLDLDRDGDVGQEGSGRRGKEEPVDDGWNNGNPTESPWDEQQAASAAAEAHAQAETAAAAQLRRELDEQNQAAIKMQALQRGRTGRAAARRQGRVDAEMRALEAQQAAARTRSEARRERDRQNRAATQMQALQRGRQARRRRCRPSSPPSPPNRSQARSAAIEKRLGVGGLRDERQRRSSSASRRRASARQHQSDGPTNLRATNGEAEADVPLHIFLAQNGIQPGRLGSAADLDMRSQIREANRVRNQRQQQQQHHQQLLEPLPLSPDDPSVAAAAALVADRVMESMEHLSKRDDIIEELQQQLTVALASVANATAASDPHDRVRRLPALRAGTTVRKRTSPRKARSTVKGSTFGGFSAHGEVVRPTPPKRYGQALSPPRMVRSPSGTLRHRFLKRTSQRVDIGPSAGQFASHRTYTTMEQKRIKLQRLQRLQKKKAGKTLSARKASKYGRVSAKRGGGSYEFRRWSQRERQQQWQIDPDNVVLQGLVEKFQVAAQKRMKPSLQSFDGAPMDRATFKRVVYVELQIMLSGAELECVFDTFDRDRSGLVDYKETIHYLFSDLSSPTKPLPPPIFV